MSSRAEAPLWAQEELARLTEHPQALVRRWAVERLAERFGEGAQEVIAARLADPDPGVAGAAVYAAGTLGLKGCAAGLLACLRSSEGRIAGAAAMALATLGDARVLDAVQERDAAGLLSAEERRTAWLGVGALPGAEACQFLLDAFRLALARGETADVRTATSALALRPEPGAAEAAARELLSTGRRQVREAIIEGLLLLTDYPMPADELTRLATGKDRAGAREIIQPALRRLGNLVEAPALADLRRVWARGEPEQLLAIVAEIVEEVDKTHGAGRQLRGSVALLRALSQGRKAMARLGRTARREIACLALLALDRVAGLVGVLTFRASEDRAEHLRLLLSHDLDPSVVDAGLGRLLGLRPTPDMVSDCLQALSGTSPRARAVACRLLGGWGVREAIPRLVAALADEPEAVEALASFGEAGLEGAREVLETGTDAVAVEAALDLVTQVPCRFAVGLLAQNFERLWVFAPDAVLRATEALAAPELIDPLRRELREGEAEAERVYLLLSELQAPEDPLAEAIRSRRKEPRPGRLPLALKCRGCGRAYTYEVASVYVDPDARDLEPVIADEIRCKGCGRRDDHELTPQGWLAIIAHLERLLDAAPGEEATEGSPVKLATLELYDGRRMAPARALADYEAKLAGAPDDPALHVGRANILRFLKRHEAAEAAYRRALELDPLAAEAYQALAALAAERHDFSAALQLMERCVATLPRARFYRVRDQRAFDAAAREQLEEFRRRALIRLPDVSPGAVPMPSASRPRVGRNAPCPCGSGKKYKKCCLSREGAPALAAPSGPDASLRDKLVEFTHRLSKREMERALALFWGEQFDPETRSLRAEDEEEGVAFLDWLIHDYRIESTGRRITQEVLARHAHLLSPEERAILAEWQEAPVGLYQVTEVERGQGLALRDVWSGATHRVREVRGSRGVARWDLLVTRLVRVRGEPFLSGTALVFLPGEKDEVIRHVEERFRAWEQQHAGGSLPDFFRDESLIFRRLSRTLAEKRREEWSQKALLTPEGHSVVLARAHSEVRAPEGVLRALRSAEDFDEGEPGPGETASFSWLRLGPSAHLAATRGTTSEGIEVTGYRVAPGSNAVPTLGTVTLKGNRLVLDCLSRERLEWGKARLATLLGRNVIFRADLIEAVGPKLAAEEDRPKPLQRSERIPSEVEADVLARLLQHHYTRWLDHPVPALEGRSPRQAARDPGARKALEELLRQFENQEDRRRAEGETSFNVSWLWRELGLSPP